VEPCSNGIGGDAFAQVWTKDGLFGLNSTGFCPRLLTADMVRAAGYDKMPSQGFFPQTVPGVPAAWAALNARFGKEPLSESSPYEFAATYSDSELYIRGDGSIWTVAPRSSNKLDSFHVQPYFPEIAASPPTAEQTLELTNLSLDAIPRLYFGFTADHVDNPYSVLSAQLEDGNWYTLRLKNRVFDLSYKDSRYNSSHHHGSIDLPFNANIIYTPAGQYSLALYDTVDGEEVLLASQEFTLTWEGSYCRITGTEQ